MSLLSSFTLSLEHVPFFLVVSAHLNKTLIGNLTLNIILVKPLNNLVQLADAVLCLFKLTLSILEVPFKLGL